MARIQGGDVVGGRYQLERQIGEGGMAAVWRAVDLTLDRPVAVKFLFAADERERDALANEFLREAKLAASVRHRNVVQILDFGTHDDGVPFMVMELLEGDTLGDRFDQGEMFDLREIVELLLQTLKGLAAVHDAGIIHRDLKPENIFLVRERDGVYPKLLDFGISKSMDPETGKRSAVTTRDGRVIGTPEYMSPEQARGLADLDKRTDIYSMGVVVYEALAGQPPFESENTGDLMVMVIHGQAEPLVELLPEAGQEMSDVVARAMHRDRAERFVDATEFHDQLLASLRTVLARDGHKPISLPPQRSRHRGDRSEDKTLDAAVVEAVMPVVRGSAAPVPVAAGARPVPRWIVAVAALAVAAAGLFAFALAARTPPQSGAERIFVVHGAHAESEDGLPAEAAEARPATRQAPTSEVETGTAVEPEAAAQRAPDTTDQETATAAATPRPVAPAAGTARPGTAKPERVAGAAEPRAANDQVSALTRAFNRQIRGVAQCFDRHSEAIAAGETLSVRVALRQDGSVQQATVSPDAVAATELGTCIGQAVSAMRFGPQPEVIAFRVPLTARRQP